MKSGRAERGDFVAREVEVSLVFCLYFKDMRDYCESSEDAARLLRHHGVNPTRQRIVIARALFCRAQHLSAEEVCELVNGTDARTSKATVYNTLNLFSERGLIREVVAQPGKVYYDSNTAPHHHFYDVDTGRLIDIDPEELVLDHLPDLPPGTVAEGVDVIVRIRSGVAP